MTNGPGGITPQCKDYFFHIFSRQMPSVSGRHLLFVGYFDILIKTRFGGSYGIRR